MLLLVKLSYPNALMLLQIYIVTSASREAVQLALDDVTGKNYMDALEGKTVPLPDTL